MEEYISQLPLELQQSILTDIPRYRRLGTRQYAGENRLRQLCNKKISKKEFYSYIDEFEPRSFIIFINYNNIYYGLEVLPIYGLEDIYYTILEHKLSIDNNQPNSPIGIKLETNEKELYAEDFEDLINIYNYNDINYDIVTTNNIIKNYRNECYNLINNYNQLHLTNNLNTNIVDVNDGSDLNVIYNNLKNNFYLFYNTKMIEKLGYDLEEVVDALDMDFDNQGNLIDGKDVFENILNNLEDDNDKYLNKINNYIKK